MRERTALVRLGAARETAAGAERRRWRRRSEAPKVVLPERALRPALRRARLALAALCVAVTGLGAARLSSSDDTLSERIHQGCEEVLPCRELETEAMRRLEDCWLGCGPAQADARMARSHRYRAEERSAVRAHYRERDAAERSEQQLERDRRLAEREQEQAEQRADAEQEQRERLELERLRQDRIDRRREEERQRRVGYLTLLAPEARVQRLERCHAQKAGCEALVLDLIDAALDADEKRKLADANESLSSRGAAPKSAPAQPAPLGPNS